ncbi:MAG: PEP-CTERM sorting domain-containing protein [Pseudomonadota bacterium]
MSINTKAALAVLGLSGALMAGAASAATLAGNNVSFSFDANALGLFGTASVDGDSLVFSPANFLASGAAPSATQTVNITVTANPGYFLSAFSLAEEGEYRLPSLSDMVWLQGNLTALDIEGNTSLSVASNIVGPAFVGGTSGSWQGGAAVVLPASGWGGADGLVTSVSLTINNYLFATGGGQIWKEAITVEAIATPVPEADTALMMLAGLGLVGLMASRRTRLAD